METNPEEEYSPFKAFLIPRNIPDDKANDWANWHMNNCSGHIYSERIDQDYAELSEKGCVYNTDIECDVRENDNYRTTEKTVKRISMRLHGCSGGCDGSLLIQYGRGETHECKTEVYDIQDFDPVEMYKLGHMLLRLAHTLGIDEFYPLSDEN